MHCSKHTDAFRKFVDDPIDLARDQQHLLLPPTLRRDYVFRLAADLVEAVLDLRDCVQEENTLEALDQARPDWRNNMPLAIESFPGAENSWPGCSLKQLETRSMEGPIFASSAFCVVPALAGGSGRE